MVKSRVTDEEFSRTISIKGVNINDYKLNYKPNLTKNNKGVNISYYQTAGNFLTNNVHIDQENNATREDIDKAIDSAFSKVILQDKVKSAKDYYKVNNKQNPTAKKYMIDIPLSKLENTELDSYIHLGLVLYHLGNQ